MQESTKSEKPSLIDAGSIFPIIASFLTQSEKINLASTNKSIREIILTNNCWPVIQILEMAHSTELWNNFFLWVFKYLKEIMPESIVISVNQNDYEQAFLKLLMNGVIQSVEKLDLYFESDDIHLGASLCFPNVTDLTLRSQCASNQLVSFMFENLTKITGLTVIKNDMNFTCDKFSNYSKNQMQKLELKPYLLDFEQIQKITQKSASTLRQLEIDVEECHGQMIVDIITPLKNLQKLRLYHLENLHSDEELVQIVESTDNISQLTATKAYNFKLTRVINSFKSPSLLALDITDSKYFHDDDLMNLSKNSPNLKFLNISWCNNLTCKSLQIMIQSCLKLETLNITGIKQSRDTIFSEYLYLLPKFDQNLYLHIKNQIRSKKQALPENLSETILLNQITRIQDSFDVDMLMFNRKLDQDREKIKSLRNLKVLDCRSCNGVSDKILACIYVLNRKVKVANYYGNQISLFTEDYQDCF